MALKNQINHNVSKTNLPISSKFGVLTALMHNGRVNEVLKWQ